MKGITFDNVHSYRDLDLVLTRIVLGSPEVKENKIDVPGADGVLDLTDFFGEPKYGNAVHRFEYAIIHPGSDLFAHHSTVKSALHGKVKRIVIDDDPLFFYIGRLKVSDLSTDRGVGFFSVEADCDPYKYKLNNTVVTQSVNGTANITLTNGRKRATPTITTSASMTFTFDSYSTTRGAGTFIIPELELREGANTVTVSGAGTVIFTWQEANL